MSSVFPQDRESRPRASGRLLAHDELRPQEAGGPPAKPPRRPHVAISGLDGFFSGIPRELGRVEWPTLYEVRVYTTVVLIAVAFIAVFLALADLLFAAAVAALEGLLSQ